MRLKLTDLSINRLKYQHPQVTYWDTLLPAFGVRVGLRSKTFIVMRGKARNREKLGSYPSMTLQRARDAARLALGAPQALADVSVKDAVELYLSQLRLRPRTVADYNRFLRLYMLPSIGSNDITKITASDILAITDPLLDKPSECRHAHAAMQTFFAWCMPRYRSSSPMFGLRSPTKPNSRSRVLTDDELKKVWIASEQLGAFGCIVRLCLLTAQRRGELSQIQPGWITKSTVEFPPTVTKNHRAHILPLSLTSIEVLNSFANTSVRAWSKPKKKLDQISGVTGWTLHDLRRTTATNLARLGTNPFTIERILNHTMPQLQRTYNRHDFTEDMREPLQKHEDWLLALVKS